jgi:hypothetical protein
MRWFLAGLRKWWRWRMRRHQVHFYGIAVFRTTGTVTADDGRAWHVEDAEGRVVRAAHRPEDGEIRIGDRVEIEPMLQPTTITRVTWVPWWIIVRKL